MWTVCNAGTVVLSDSACYDFNTPNMNLCMCDDQISNRSSLYKRDLCMMKYSTLFKLVKMKTSLCMPCLKFAFIR